MPSAFGEHIQFSTEVLSAEWSDDDLTLVGARSAGRRHRGDPRRRRGRQRRRPAQPAAVSGHRGPRELRRSGVPFGPLGFVGRSRGQARRRDRHRRERDAAHPRDRSDRRRAARCSSGRRRGSARLPTTTIRSPMGSGGCTRTCPRTASSTASGSSGRWATARSPTSRVDPAYGPTERSVSELNDVMRLLLTEYITAEFGDRPDLLEHVVPQYPPGSKRGIRDNGVWARALKRDNVRLEHGADRCHHRARHRHGRRHGA